MEVIVVDIDSISPCAFKMDEIANVLEHVMQALHSMSEVSIWYENMDEEQYEALSEFEGS